MLISAPFSKATDSKGFVLDLILAMQPDKIYVDEQYILEKPEQFHSRYSGILDDVVINVADIKYVSYLKIDDTKKILFLVQVDNLMHSASRCDEVCTFLRSTILYPSPAELRVDINKIITVLGE